MPFQRKLECAISHGPTGGRLGVTWFTINDYPSYKGAFKIANEEASEFLGGKLVVFDNRAVTLSVINAIENDDSGSSKMTELLYLQNIHSLLHSLEEASEGFINRFDKILPTMIEETELRIDLIRFENKLTTNQ